MKTKLVKPEELNKILDNSLILKSRQKYVRLAQSGMPCSISSLMTTEIMQSMCAARNRQNISESLHRYDLCNNIRFCHECFLNANNYLNILKYLKHRYDGKTKETKENQ